MTSYLQRIAELNRRIDVLVDSVNRVPTVVSACTQWLRLFFTHKFVPLSAIEPAANGEKERPYFLFRIDGLLFDLGDATTRVCSLRSYIDSVTVTVFLDRRQQTVLCSYEWSTTSYPVGLSADSIILKLAAEKSCFCRVEMRFSDHVVGKYSISPMLMELLQSKSNELTKQEICEIFLYYIVRRGLFLEKDSRTFKSDETLVPILGDEIFCKTSDIWPKLLSSGHVSLIDRLELDIPLSSTNHQISLQNNLLSFLQSSAVSLSNNSIQSFASHNLASISGNPLVESTIPDALIGNASRDNTSVPTIKDMIRSIGGRILDIEVLSTSSQSRSDSALYHQHIHIANARYTVDTQLRNSQLQIAFCGRELREETFLCQVLLNCLENLQHHLSNNPNIISEGDAAHVNSNSSERKRKIVDILNDCNIERDFPKPPIATELLAKRRTVKPTTATGTVTAVVEKRFQPFRTQLSAVHGFSSFVDLGKDDVFHCSTRWIVDSYGLQMQPQAQKNGSTAKPEANNSSAYSI